MSERTTEVIRKELADERRKLDEELYGLDAEIRSFVPFLIGGVATIALLTGGKGLRTGAKLVWKLL